MKHFKALMLVAACLLSFPVASLAQQASPIVIKFSHVVAADTPKGKAAERFKQLLTAAERAEWRKVLQPVQDEMATRVGKDLVTAIRKETDAAL